VAEQSGRLPTYRGSILCGPTKYADASKARGIVANEAVASSILNSNGWYRRWSATGLESQGEARASIVRFVYHPPILKSKPARVPRVIGNQFVSVNWHLPRAQCSPPIRVGPRREVAASKTAK
jgi:hypothetical protein